MASPKTTRRLALKCFQSMLAAAKHYVETKEVGELKLRYGICDNISEFRDSGIAEGTLGLIKDNLIRRTTSFSGNFSYPVAGDHAEEWNSAEYTWDRTDNKWEGEYGERRIKQLEELVYLIDNHWEDRFCERMSPLEQMGLGIGSLMIDRSGNLHEVVEDDRSHSPMFRKLSNDDRNYICVSELRPVKVELMGDKSVTELVGMADEILAKRKELEAKIAELQSEIAKGQAELSMVDIALRSQHKVKRI